MFALVNHLGQRVAVASAVILVVHYKVVPLGPQPHESVERAGVVLSSEPATHASCAGGSHLVDVGDVDASVADILPYVMFSPYRQRPRCGVLLAVLAERVAPASLDVCRLPCVPFRGQQSEEWASSRALHVVVRRLFLQPEAAAVAHLIRLVQQIHPSLRDVMWVAEP